MPDPDQGAEHPPLAQEPETLPEGPGREEQLQLWPPADEARGQSRDSRREPPRGCRSSSALCGLCEPILRNTREKEFWGIPCSLIKLPRPRASRLGELQGRISVTENGKT